MKPYRAIPIGGKDFVYGWYVEAKTYSVIIPQNCHVYEFFSDGIEVIPETVGQSTGRKDKNGKEIYGKDILKNWKTSIVVSWNKKRLCWDATDLNTKQASMLSSWGIENDFEIIGDIHTKPELLEK